MVVASGASLGLVERHGGYVVVLHYLKEKRTEEKHEILQYYDRNMNNNSAVLYITSKRKMHALSEIRV